MFPSEAYVAAHWFLNKVPDFANSLEYSTTNLITGQVWFSTRNKKTFLRDYNFDDRLESPFLVHCNRHTITTTVFLKTQKAKYVTRVGSVLAKEAN